MGDERNLSVGRNFKIGFFHLGSGMADVLTTGVWNRIMISDLGFSATVVGLLLALRYFLAPLGIWAGRISDERVVGGYRRLFWVWLGRAMMVVSTFTLGYATAEFIRFKDAPQTAHWLIAALSLLLFSVGSAISGATFLSLIYDRTPAHQRGRAVGIVWTFLLLGFTIGGIFFGRMIPENKDEAATGLLYLPETVLNLFIISGIVFFGLWLLSLWGEEKRQPSGKIASATPDAAPPTSLRQDLSLVWHNPALRYFLIYLTCSMFFAFSQDAILEPWAAQVFEMPLTTTSRFSGYWGSMAILGTIVFLFLGRRYPRLTNTVMSQMGAGALAITFGLFTFASVAEIRPLVTVSLMTLGIGLGIWNVGTLGLMMELSPAGRAGTFLGFWTMAVTLARGGGVAGGGIFRDVFLHLTGSLPVAYGLAFGIGAAGLLVSMWALSQVNVKAFKKEETSVNVEGVLAAAMD